MSNIDNETVKNLSELARIELTDEEVAKIKTDLEKILKFMDKLSEVDTNGIEPTFHVASDLVNVSRPDDQKRDNELLDRATFLALAPDQVGGMVKVPSFMGGKDE